MLKLKQLKFSGIGRFVEEQVIDFTVLGNLVQVDGLRTDTGGSSGSGKSTIFNCLDFLLGLNDLANGILQSRYTKEGMLVSGIFDYDGLSLVITRGKGKISVVLDGNPATGSKLAEEKIDQILGMPRDLFRKILHKRQREGGFFLDLTPSKTFEFLTDALGLAAIRKHLETVDSKIKEIFPKLELSKSDLDKSKASLEATQSAIGAQGEAPAPQVTQEHILVLKSALKTSEEALDCPKNDLQGACNDLTAVKAKHVLEIRTLELERPRLATELLDSHPLRAELNQAIQRVNSVNQKHAFEVQALDVERPTLSVFTPDTANLKTLEQALAQLQMKKASLVQEENDRVSQVKSQISALNLTVSDLNHKISKSAQAKNEALKVAQEIKKIRDSICPTCEQNWATDSAKAKESQLLEKIKEYKETIRIGAESQISLDQANASIQSLRTTSEFSLSSVIGAIDDQEQQLKLTIQEEKRAHEAEAKAFNEANNASLAIFSQKQRNLVQIQTSELKSASALVEQIKNQIAVALNESNNANLLAFSSKQKEIYATQSREIEQINALIERANSTITTVQSLIAHNKAQLDSNVQRFKFHLEAVNKHNASLNILKEQESKVQSKIIDLERDLASHKQNLDIAEEAKKAIKSYLSCSFDDALECIGDTATRIIRGIPNMANATISLEGIKEMNNGKVKEEVNAVLSMDGEEGIPIKSLSGGERSSVDLAVDLAVIDLLEIKSGKGVDLFVLDEAFTGMDTVSTEMALEVLKTFSQTKRLIIVEHNPVVSQMVTDKIMVHRDGQTSRIVQ